MNWSTRVGGGGGGVGEGGGGGWGVGGGVGGGLPTFTKKSFIKSGIWSSGIVVPSFSSEICGFVVDFLLGKRSLMFFQNFALSFLLVSN